MPGSRQVEIKRHWQVFEQTVKILQTKHENLTFVLIEGENVNINSNLDLIKVKESQYEAIGVADAAIVCSGTATLEASMLRCPMVVCYKLSWATWFFAKAMSKVKYLSLTNLIAEDEIVEELLQDKMNAKKLSQSITSLLNPKNKYELLKKYDKLIMKLKNSENVYDSAAKYIYD